MATPIEIPVCRTRSRQGLEQARPNKSTSETRRSLRSEIPDDPCAARRQEPSASVGGFLFCWRFAGWCGILGLVQQLGIYKGEY